MVGGAVKIAVSRLNQAPARTQSICPAEFGQDCERAGGAYFERFAVVGTDAAVFDDTEEIAIVALYDSGPWNRTIGAAAEAVQGNEPTVGCHPEHGPGAVTAPAGSRAVEISVGPLSKSGQWRSPIVEPERMQGDEPTVEEHPEYRSG